MITTSIDWVIPHKDATVALYSMAKAFVRYSKKIDKATAEGDFRRVQAYHRMQSSKLLRLESCCDAMGIDFNTLMFQTIKAYKGDADK